MEQTKTEIRKTITSIFMVPTLKFPKGTLNDNNFLNGFIKDKMKDIEYKDSVYLLFRPKNLDQFRIFLDTEYERTRQIIDDYDYPNGFVVVVYKLDPKFSLDFQLIRMGKYSKTSSTFQELFPKTVTLKRGTVSVEQVSLQYRIFNKTEELLKFWEDKFNVTFDSDQELWHGFDEEYETLTEETLKMYENQ